MKLLVTRHGQTPWGVEHRICGRTDVPLNDTGRRQARQLAESLRGRKIDLIVASPLGRALETARIVGSVCGAPLVVEPGLIEQDYGVYEGKDQRDPGFLENKSRFAWRYPGGESMLQLAHRVYGVLEKLREEHPDKTVLIVCHGGVCRVLRTYFMDVTNEDFRRFSMGNCALEEFEL